MSDDYIYDEFIGEPDKSPQELQVQNLHLLLNNFVEDLDVFTKNFQDEWHESFKIKNDVNTLLFTGNELKGNSFFFYDSQTPMLDLNLQLTESLRYDEILQQNNPNPMISKVFTVLANLEHEMSTLEKKAKKSIFPKLVMFGETGKAEKEEQTNQEQIKPEDAAKQSEEKKANMEKNFIFAKSLPFFIDLWNFVTRIQFVIKNTIQNLSQIFSSKYANTSKLDNDEMKSLGTFSSASFTNIFDALAKTISILITTDRLIQANTHISNALNFYKRFLKKISDDPNLEKYYVPKKEINTEPKPEIIPAPSADGKTPASTATSPQPPADVPQPADPTNPEQPKEKLISKKNIEEILEFLMKLDAEILEPDAVFKSLCNMNFTSIDAKTTFVPAKDVDNYDRIEISNNSVLKSHFEQEIATFLTYGLSNIQIYSMAQNLNPNLAEAKGSFLNILAKGNKPIDITNISEKDLRQYATDLRARLAEFESTFFGFIDDKYNFKREPDTLIGYIGLYILYLIMFYDNSDTLMFKKVWTLCKHFPIVHLFGNASIEPGNFFLQHLTDLNQFRLINVKIPQKELEESNIIAFRTYSNLQSLKNKVYHLSQSVQLWITRFESAISSLSGAGKTQANPQPGTQSPQVTMTDPVQQQQYIVGMLGTYIAQGVNIFEEISFLLTNTFSLFTANNKPMTKSTVLWMAKLFELLKMIQHSLCVKKKAEVAQHLSIITQYLGYKAHRILSSKVVKKMEARKKTVAQVDQLSAMTLALNLLSQPITEKKYLILKMALAVGLQDFTYFNGVITKHDNVSNIYNFKPIFKSDIMTEKDILVVYNLVQRIHLLSSFPDILSNHIENHLSHFLYFSREAMVPTVFEYIIQSAEKVSHSCLLWFFLALKDCAASLLAPQHMIHLGDEKLYFENDYNFFAKKEYVEKMELIAKDPQKRSVEQNFRETIVKLLEGTIIHPISTSVENDLRLHIHSSVIGKKKLNFDFAALAQADSSKVQNKKAPKQVMIEAPEDEEDFEKTTNLLKIDPFYFIATLDDKNYRIDLKEQVVKYLDKQFYNLTAISQKYNDWKLYEEMRILAQEKYGLQMLNVFLPSQTLGQNLDILEITKNIHVFVKDYCYNLNTNSFVEKSSNYNPKMAKEKKEKKNLHSVSIKHVSNSIRTHGTGIMNNAVNFVYQFMMRKFFIFSQFLFDDHIKSRLIAEVRKFKQYKQEILEQNKQDSKYSKTDTRENYFLTNFFADDDENAKKKKKEEENAVADQMVVTYPIQFALGVSRDIKKLGASESGMNFLDEFRVLITEIGNALGYVRMVRGGGLHCISEEIQFVQKLESAENSFDQYAQDDKLSPETIESAQTLAKIVKNLTGKFAEGSDYFKLLEKVFHNELSKDETHTHLANFSIMVPALTLSFVDSMRIAKEKMTRSSSSSAAADAYYTQDGFTLGIAFILKVLSLNEKFDSLHWFESVSQYYTAEMQKVKNQMSAEETRVDPIKKKIAAAQAAQAAAQAFERQQQSEEVQTLNLTLDKIRDHKREFELLFMSFSGSRVFFRDQ